MHGIDGFKTKMVFVCEKCGEVCWTPAEAQTHANIEKEIEEFKNGGLKKIEFLTPAIIDGEEVFLYGKELNHKIKADEIKLKKIKGFPLSSISSISKNDQKLSLLIGGGVILGGIVSWEGPPEIYPRFSVDTILINDSLLPQIKKFIEEYLERWAEEMKRRYVA